MGTWTLCGNLLGTPAFLFATEEGPGFSLVLGVPLLLLLVGILVTSLYFANNWSRFASRFQDRTDRSHDLPQTSAVRRYQATDPLVPPEVEALGEPENVLRAEHLHPVPWVVAGVVLIVGSIVLIPWLRGENTWILVVAAFGGLGLIGLPWIVWSHQQHEETYLLYPVHLVLVRQDEYIVIPWDEIQEWNAASRKFTTSDRQQFEVTNSLVIGRIVEFITEWLLPVALAAIESGEGIKFGPFRITRNALTYKGHHMPWHNIKKMVFEVYKQALRIEEHDGFLPRMCYISNAPNHFILLELIRFAAPQHLLLTPEQTR